MKNSLALLAAAVFFVGPLAGDVSNAQYRDALPGYRYEFPRDHFNHPDFQTEWWYYTGNLKSSDGRAFGFELTFFRQGISRDASKKNPWDLQDIYVAHLALSDLKDGHYYFKERANRSGPGIAGVSTAEGRIWNGNWQAVFQGEDQLLQAIDEHFELHFTLHPAKRPVVHGENGVSQKAEGIGRASHYISFTRLSTSGWILKERKKVEVSGLAWMDHEFFTRQLEADQTGWDWLSLQMDDHTELMLFRIRRKDGSIDSHSSGTYLDAQGKSTHLSSNDFVLQPLGKTWTSPKTHTTYPILWKITVPRLGIELTSSTGLSSQEFKGKTSLTPVYWEGAIMLSGTRAAQPLSGVGYLEMTGYDRPVQLAP